MSTTKHIYNCIITRSAPSALKMRALPPMLTPLPAHVDLRTSKNMPPVYDQGQLGSCTANALCGAFEFDSPGYMGSRLFLYYNERMLEHTIADDAGAMLSDGVRCLEKYGVCAEAEWPYVITQFTTKPPAKCYTDAMKHQALKASNIPDTMSGMKQSLALGFPFVVGISIFASFESAAVAATGVVPMPTPGEENLGGHAVLVVGYDDAHSWFVVRNSWGPTWGDKGYFYLPYAYLANSGLASDMWNITSVEV